MVKVYVTKYALTQGILEAEGKFSDSGNTFTVRWTFYDTYYHGNDWHISRESAVEKAEEMRTKKLISLDKQVKKISALEF